MKDPKNLRKTPVTPLHYGGGREGGLRPGALPAPLCAGFRAAAQTAKEEQADFSARAAALAERLLEGILQVREDTRMNGRPEHSAAGCLSITFPGILYNALIDGLHGIDISSGSACTATSVRSSHVLKAMQYSKARADSAIRIAIRHFTTEADIDRAVRVIQRYFQT